MQRTVLRSAAAHLRVLVIAAPMWLAGVPASAAGARVVHRIEIVGNERTAPVVIERALEVGPGDPFEPAAVPVLEQRVANLRLFKHVHVEPLEDGPDGVVLRVAVEERWTLIAVPVFGAYHGVVGGGVAAQEANLFGRAKQLGLGVFFSNRGTSQRVAYRDPAVLESRLLFTADLARVDMLREQDLGTTTVYQYQDLRYDLGATVGWRLAEGLAVRGGWFTLLANATPEAGFAPPPRAPPVRGLSAEVEYGAEDYHLWHVTGFSTRLRYRQGVSWLASDRSLRQVSATGSWSRRAFDDHALTLAATFDAVDGDPVIDAVRLGGQPGSRGFYRSGLWAETAATGTAEYQIPFWHGSWAVTTWATFCDVGVTRWRGTSTGYAAPGTGVRLYLRNVAIPALGLDVAWATPMPNPEFSFVAGWRL